MSIFGRIKTAIFGDKGPLGGQFGGRRDAAPAATSTQPAAPVQPAPQPGAAPAAQPAAPPPPAEPVDVEAVLTDLATRKGATLNWRTSIVDLMKLLDIDSSLDNRKELATELGYTGEKNGSADMNIWLHKAVMRELAKNGGRVPASLAD